MIKIVELLSPARDMASLNSAINNGADSVYVGVEGYNMRANVKNFTIREFEEAVETCHLSGVKLYVCTNTTMKEDDLDELRSLMPRIRSSGVDAVIASDLGAVNIARENGMPVHMSVQANLSNSEAIKVLKDFGVGRVVLSREISLKDIRKIIKNTDMEIEVFVHGAMCVAVSGRCFLSSYLYDESANCGACLQPCRKEWTILSEDDEELKISGGSDLQSMSHIFSPKDLCMLEHIPELIEAGVHAFKIEGRARSADYVATVTRVYREAIETYENGSWDDEDTYLKLDNWKNDLKKVFNRGFDTGFYYKIPNETSSANQATVVKKDIGEVVNYYQKVSAAEVRLWGPLAVGDEIIVQGSTTGSIEMRVESIQVNGSNITKADKDQNVAIHSEHKLRPKDVIYKRIKKSKI